MWSTEVFVRYFEMYTCLECTVLVYKNFPLKKEMATHSSSLAWEIPWTEEPGRIQSIASQRAGYNWATLTLPLFFFPVKQAELNLPITGLVRAFNRKTHVARLQGRSVLLWFLRLFVNETPLVRSTRLDQTMHSTEQRLLHAGWSTLLSSSGSQTAGYITISWRACSYHYTFYLDEFDYFNTSCQWNHTVIILCVCVTGLFY